MATRQEKQFIWRHLWQFGGLRDESSVADGVLLEQFTRQGSEAAFALLVRRHGPMVWGVCRRILGHVQDAEDAFQAVFVVLARKANSIVPKKWVGQWLHGVAYRTALKAKSLRAKRRVKEVQAQTMAPTMQEPIEQWLDLEPLLDREIERLPDKYRRAVVLCELEGRSRKDAAKLLGVPEGTLSSRLATARKMLARRLTQQGVALSATALATLLGNQPSAAMPISVLNATVESVIGSLHDGATVPAQVSLLSQGVMKSMLLSTLKAAAGVVAIGVALFAGAITLYLSNAASPLAQARDSYRSEAKVGNPKKREIAKTVTIPLQTTVAAEMAKIINDIYRIKPRAKNGKLPVVAADARTNAVLISADAVRMKEIKELIRLIDSPPNRKQKSQVAPAVDGLQLSLRAKPASTRLNAKGDNAEPVKLQLTFRNIGAMPMIVDTYDYLWARVSIRLTGPNKKSIRILDSDVERKKRPRKPEDNKLLLPGQEFAMPAFSFPGFCGGSHYQFLEQGAYRIEVTYQSKGNQPVLANAKFWQGSVTSNQVTIQVAPLEKKADMRITEVIRLQRVDAVATAALLKQLFRLGHQAKDGRRAGITVEERTNSLIVVATPADIKMIREILNRIDASGHANSSAKKTPAASENKGLRFSARVLKKMTIMNTDGDNIEPVQLEITFENVGNKALLLDRYDFKWQHLRFQVAGPNKDSVEHLPVTESRPVPSRRPDDNLLLAPGEKWTAPVFAVPSNWGFSNFRLREAGKYHIKVIYFAQKRGSPIADVPFWYGSIASNEVAINVQPKKKAQPALRAESWDGSIGNAALMKLPNPVAVPKNRPVKIGVIRDAKTFNAVAQHTKGYLPQKGQKPIWPRWKNEIDWKREMVIYAALTNSTNQLRFQGWKSLMGRVGIFQMHWDGIQPLYNGYQSAVLCRVPRQELGNIQVHVNNEQLAEIKVGK